MVTKPDRPNPPAPEPLRPNPTKIQAPTQVAGVSTEGGSLDAPDAANRDRTGENKFKLPDKVSQKDILDGSFKYGGGRSAGNRSIAENKARRENQP